MDELVLYEVIDGAALITWNRPDRMNGWTPPLQVAYHDALRRAVADDGVGAIVVTGAGRGFCVGADADYLREIEAAGGAPTHRDPMILPLRIPKLIIAAVNGGCAGIGLLQALVCDLRFVSTKAKMTTSFARLGLIGEHATAWLLPRIVGTSRAADLLLSGRIVLAEEAVQLGLANVAVEPEDLVSYALRYAQDVAANCSPASVARMKQQLLDESSMSLDDAYAESITLMKSALAGPDFIEGIASLKEKRRPDFPPLGRGTTFTL